MPKVAKTQAISAATSRPQTLMHTTYTSHGWVLHMTPLVRLISHRESPRDMTPLMTPLARLSQPGCHLAHVKYQLPTNRLTTPIVSPLLEATQPRHPYTTPTC